MTEIDEIIAFCDAYCRHSTQIWLAYSGGLDSSFLLHILATSSLKERVKAIHINHGLSPYANQWEAHCRAQCAAYGVTFFSRKVDVHSRHGSTESAARALRYEVFAQFVSAGDLLLSGHHGDDQAETLLYRLLRGAGLQGLAAIACARTFNQKAQVLRPLLQWSKAKIQQSAETLGLSWVHDESNSDTQFDRNFLREDIFPLLESRWPQARKKLAQSATWLREADTLLEDYVREDLVTCERRLARDGESIALKTFCKFSPERQKHILRTWSRLCFACVPQAAQLAQLDGLISAREDAAPLVKWGNCECRRYRGRLYLVAHRETVSKTALSWRSDKDLLLDDASRLRCDTASMDKQDAFEFTVIFRQGGERCKPLQRQHSQTLKKLLQDYALEPWLRERVPLIFFDDELVAVGDLFVCESAFARAHPTVKFTWQWDVEGSSNVEYSA